MCWCHIQAYNLIHAMRREMGYDDTKVGFANHVRVFEPKNPRNPLHSRGIGGVGMGLSGRRVQSRHAAAIS
jgi:hypothetical protein